MIFFRFEHPKPSLRRIRSLSDTNPSGPMEECVIQREPKKQIRARIGLIVQTYLRNVDCVRDVHTTLMTLVLTATLEVLAVEVWCPELRTTVESKTSLKFHLSRHFLYQIFLMRSSRFVVQDLHPSMSTRFHSPRLPFYLHRTIRLGLILYRYLLNISSISKAIGSRSC